MHVTTAFKRSTSGEPHNRVLNVYNTPNQLKRHFIRCWAALSLSGHRSKYLSSAEENNLPFCFKSRAWIFFCSLPFYGINEWKWHSWFTEDAFIYLFRNTELSACIWKCHLNLKNASPKLISLTRCFWNRLSWRVIALHTCLQNNWSHLISWNFSRTRDMAYLYELLVSYFSQNIGFLQILTNWHFYTWSWISLQKI